LKVLHRRGVLAGTVLAGSLLAGTGCAASVVREPRSPLAGSDRLLNASAFGTIGDGRADDTAALQAALDAGIRDRNGGVLVIPPGVYRVTRPIRVETRDRPHGNVTRACVVQAKGVRIVSDIRSADPIIEVVSNSVMRYLRIDGLEIRGNGRESHGLVLTCVRRGRYIYNFCLRDVIVEGCGGDGCRMTGNVFEGQVFNSYFRDNRGNGVTLSHGAEDTVLSAVHFFGCVFGGNRVHGVAMINGAEDVGFQGCYFLLNGKYGLIADRGCGLLSHCGFENNHQQASSFEEGGAGMRLLVRGTLVGCTSYSVFNQTHLLSAYVTDELTMVGCTGRGGGKAKRAGLAKIEGPEGSRAALIGCVGAVEPEGRIAVVGPIAGGNATFGASWDSNDLLRIGDHRLWVDRSGRLRIKAGAPSADDDGSPLNG